MVILMDFMVIYADFMVVSGDSMVIYGDLTELNGIWWWFVVNWTRVMWTMVIYGEIMVTWWWFGDLVGFIYDYDIENGHV